MRTVRHAQYNARPHTRSAFINWRHWAPQATHIDRKAIIKQSSRILTNFSFFPLLRFCVNWWKYYCYLISHEHNNCIIEQQLLMVAPSFLVQFLSFSRSRPWFCTFVNDVYFSEYCQNNWINYLFKTLNYFNYCPKFDQFTVRHRL